MNRQGARLCFLSVLVAARAALSQASQALEVTFEQDSAGKHWRLAFPAGAVHVWMPTHYQREGAGTVLYLHGYSTDVDGAWREHKLGEQFAAAHRNALFIAPEAPNGRPQEVQFPKLGELLTQVSARIHYAIPDGPVIAVGHSGAYRTLVQWLPYERLDEVVLLDALYANEDDFDAWVSKGPRHAAKRLILVGFETVIRGEAFCERFAWVGMRKSLPDRADAFSSAQRHAQVLCLESQYEHMPLVTDGRVVPMLLHLLPLHGL